MNRCSHKVIENQYYTFFFAKILNTTHALIFSVQHPGSEMNRSGRDMRVDTSVGPVYGCIGVLETQLLRQKLEKPRLKVLVATTDF